MIQDYSKYCIWGTLSPKPPGVYRITGQSMWIIKAKGRTLMHGPHTSTTRYGARVAPQRCPIPRTGIKLGI
jgi:hypothetical protein